MVQQCCSDGSSPTILSVSIRGAPTHPHTMNPKTLVFTPSEPQMLRLGPTVIQIKWPKILGGMRRSMSLRRMGGKHKNSRFDRRVHVVRRFVLVWIRTYSTLKTAASGEDRRTGVSPGEAAHHCSRQMPLANIIENSFKRHKRIRKHHVKAGR